MRADKINTYFRMMENEGWTYIQFGKEPQAVWWLVRSQTPRRRIGIYVGRMQECMLWQLPLAVQVLASCRPALSLYLLRLNHEMRLTRFSLDPEDRVHMIAETSVSSCTFTSFKEVLTAMRTYFEQYHREIELLATNPTLANVWTSLRPQSEEPVIKVLS